MSISIRLLVIEDSTEDLAVFLRHLDKNDFDVESQCVETESELRQALSQSWDIVISDYHLPNFSGLQALKIIRELQPDLPFIIISGAVDESAIVEVMKAGAQDCLLKSNLLRLVPAIKRELGEAKNKRETRKIESALRKSEQQAKDELIRSNRTLFALSACNEALFRAEDEAQLMREICQIMLREADYQMAWVGYANHDVEKTISVQASAGDVTQYLQDIQLSWADEPAGHGPTGTAIRRGVCVYVDDIAGNSNYAPWLEKAKLAGFRSSIALPLCNNDEVLGALNVYSNKVGLYSEEEIKLLTKMADNLAFGISNLRIAKEKESLKLQLMQSQKMETVGSLTGGIAHEFNNILASVLGFTDLALARPGANIDDKLESYLQEVKVAGSRGAELVTKLLMYSHGGISSPVELNISDAWKSFESMLTSLLPSSIDLAVDIKNTDLGIVIDPLHLQQIMINLIINARDAIADDGHINISISREEISNAKCKSCFSQIGGGEYACLSIADDGEGFDDKLLSKIFEPFFTTRGVGKGTGMGLPVVHGITHEHSGHIQVDSRPGDGARFRVLFPLFHNDNANLPASKFI